MKEMKNKEQNENKPTEKTRTRTPLTNIRKVKENLTLASTMEQRKMLKWQTKWSGSKKLELKKYFVKKERKKGSPLSNGILTS